MIDILSRGSSVGRVRFQRHSECGHCKKVPDGLLHHFQPLSIC